MCIVVSKRNPILPTRTSFFISGVGKCAGVLNNVFPAAASPRKWQLYKSHMATHSSFQQTCYLHFEDNVYLLNNPMKAVQNCSGLNNCSNKTGIERLKFLFPRKVKKNWFKISSSIVGWNCNVKIAMKLQLAWF